MEIMELEFNVDVEVMTNSDSIIPSRQRRVDIKWERNIKVPSRDGCYVYCADSDNPLEQYCHKQAVKVQS